MKKKKILAGMRENPQNSELGWGEVEGGRRAGRREGKRKPDKRETKKLLQQV